MLISKYGCEVFKGYKTYFFKLWNIRWRLDFVVLKIEKSQHEKKQKKKTLIRNIRDKISEMNLTPVRNFGVRIFHKKKKHMSWWKT